jgi:hypothetical protein
MVCASYPQVLYLKNVSYPHVYPQINLTDIFMICQKVVGSGEKWGMEHLLEGAS